MRCLAVAIVGSMFLGVSLAGAQEPQVAPLFPSRDPPVLFPSKNPPVLFHPSSLAAPADGQAPAQPSWLTERRACEGCPPRSVGKALFQTTVVNVFYGLANLARGQVTARVTPKTWWHNMEQGWVWDLDDFVVNQVGHPTRAATTSTPAGPTA